jgi:hypothetical protein
MRGVILSFIGLVLAAPTSAHAQPAFRCTGADGSLIITQGPPPPGATCTGAPGLAPAPGDARRWEREAAEQKMRDAPAEPRSPASAQCDARAKAWLATLPPNSQVTKDDMARAIGPDCDADALIGRVQKNVEAVKATLEECRRRWSARGDTGKVYDLKRPGVRQEMWRDMARAAGNECANLLFQ